MGDKASTLKGLPIEISEGQYPIGIQKRRVGGYLWDLVGQNWPVSVCSQSKQLDYFVKNAKFDFLFFIEIFRKVKTRAVEPNKNKRDLET